MRILGLIITACCTLAACDLKEKRDTNPAAEAWEELSTSMPARLSALRDRQTILGQRIGALGVPVGTEDAALVAMIEELKGAQGPVDDAVAKVEAAASQAQADVQNVLGGKDKIAAERAVLAGRASFEAAAAAADASLAAVEPKVNVAEQMMKRLLSTVEGEVNRLRRIASGGTADFSAIEFRDGTAELDFTRPAARATLDRIAQFASTCEELTFALVGHTAVADGEPARAKELGQARADAVKAYLVAAGVPAAKIVRTGSMGGTQPIAPEPAAGTPEAAAIDPTSLETARRRNRRIVVEVVTPCAAVAPAPAPAAAAPPAAAPPAAADPHAGHNH